MKYLTPEQWGANLSPPIGKRRAQQLVASGRILKCHCVGGNYMVEAGAPDPRKPRGRPRK